MKVVACLLATIAFLCQTGAARKSYIVKQEHKGMIPQVRQTSIYPFKKLYENLDDSVYIYYQGKMSFAYQWSQQMKENTNSLPDVYHLTLDINLKQSFYFSPNLSFPRLIYFEPVFKLDEFPMGFKFDLAKFWIYPTRADLICISSMFKIAERHVISTLIMRFQECYKTLWQCVYNRENWTGPDAKYIQKCSQSSKTTITTYEYTFPEKLYNAIGSDDDLILRTGKECSPGTGFWPFYIGDLNTSSFITNFFHYVAEKSGHGVTHDVSLLNVKNMPGDTKSVQA